MELKNGGNTIKIEIKLSSENEEPHAIIYTNKITDEIQKAVEILEKSSKPIIPVKKDNRMIFIRFDEIYIIKSANDKNNVLTENESYETQKRLYELESILGRDFFRISKSAIVNIMKIDKVSPSLNGIMYVTMKNGLSDVISRKYLPNFKKHIGL
ncbi:MAG: LytTR family transcriptional regulator [Methanobrevibacter sp.]|jgi:DNA-binding LytR/AlgR family response regulator|nr:LytTR family transcriptional regulator [Methanobrevibacter sp.]